MTDFSLVPASSTPRETSRAKAFFHTGLGIAVVGGALMSVGLTFALVTGNAVDLDMPLKIALSCAPFVITTTMVLTWTLGSRFCVTAQQQSSENREFLNYLDGLWGQRREVQERGAIIEEFRGDGALSESRGIILGLRHSEYEGKIPNQFIRDVHASHFFIEDNLARQEEGVAPYRHLKPCGEGREVIAERIDLFIDMVTALGARTEEDVLLLMKMMTQGITAKIQVPTADKYYRAGLGHHVGGQERSYDVVPTGQETLSRSDLEFWPEVSKERPQEGFAGSAFYLHRGADGGLVLDVYYQGLLMVEKTPPTIVAWTLGTLTVDLKRDTHQLTLQSAKQATSIVGLIQREAMDRALCNLTTDLPEQTDIADYRERLWGITEPRVTQSLAILESFRSDPGLNKPVTLELHDAPLVLADRHRELEGRIPASFAKDVTRFTYLIASPEESREQQKTVYSRLLPCAFTDRSDRINEFIDKLKALGFGTEEVLLIMATATPATGAFHTAAFTQMYQNTQSEDSVQVLSVGAFEQALSRGRIEPEAGVSLDSSPEMPRGPVIKIRQRAIDVIVQQPITLCTEPAKVMAWARADMSIDLEGDLAQFHLPPPAKAMTSVIDREQETII